MAPLAPHLQSGLEVLGLAIKIPGFALAEYAPAEPMLFRIPCLATVVSDASQVSKLPVARGAKAKSAKAICGAARAA